jgi:hypothetical protein
MTERFVSPKGKCVNVRWTGGSKSDPEGRGPMPFSTGFQIRPPSEISIFNSQSCHSKCFFPSNVISVKILCLDATSYNTSKYAEQVATTLHFEENGLPVLWREKNHI